MKNITGAVGVVCGTVILLAGTVTGTEHSFNLTLIGAVIIGASLYL